MLRKQIINTFNEIEMLDNIFMILGTEMLYMIWC